MAETDTAPKDLVGFLDFYLVKKAPFQIPEEAREFLVKFGPWIILVLLVISIPPLLVLLGIGTAFVPFAGAGYATGWTYFWALIAIQLVLRGMALPGLFARKMSGWKLLFYSQVAGLIGSLLIGAIVGGLIGALIGFYLLFQVRAKYVN